MNDKDKLNRILTDDNVVYSINSNLDYLLTIIPEARNMIDFPHNHPHHHLDVWHHTLLALSISPNDFTIRLALLLHDIGKPYSYQDGGVRYFKNHAYASYEISKNILYRLGYDKKFVYLVSNLIRYHDTPITKRDINDSYDAAYLRYIIQKCDALSHHPDKLEKRKDYLVKTLKLFNEF